MDVLPLDTLPVGFRFRPTDEELINHYLRLKINGFHDQVSVIREVDVCKREPWDLPDLSLVPSIDNEWFFFCPKDRKYQNGQQSNRATVAGYWKATGKDRFIKSSRGMNVIGKKKTLVFYTGRAPNGERTHWVIHEYCAADEALSGTRPGQGAFVICRLFKKHDRRQDGMGESSNREVEQHIPFPTVVESSPGDVLSEQETMDLSSQPGSYETNDETPSTIYQYSYHSNSCIGEEAEGRLPDMISVQPNPDLENALGDFQEVPAHDSIFSSNHMQMMQDFYHGSTIFGNDQNGDMDIADLLDSILASSDECSYKDSGDHPISAFGSERPNYIDSTKRSFVKDSGSCSKSDVGLVHYQLDLGSYANNGYLMEAEHISPLLMTRPPRDGVARPYGYEEAHSNLQSMQNRPAVSSAVSTSTGIKIRSPRPNYQRNTQNTHGTAPRRIRLQTGQIRSNYCSLANENAEVDPLVIKGKDAKEYQQTSVTDIAPDALSTTDETAKDHYLDEEVTQEVSLPVFSKSPVVSSISSALHIHGMFLVFGLVLVGVALCGCYVS